MSKDFIITDPYKIAEYIGNAKKTTPVKAYIIGDLTEEDYNGLDFYGDPKRSIVLGELEAVNKFLDNNKERIEKVSLDIDRKNSAIPVNNLGKYNARIEPGAIIRDHVTIGDNAVIMMGAVINIGSDIGERTMVDMNSVIGGRAQIGKDSHIGAGAVIAGVIEPPSAEPVRIGDNVLVGANAVVLEGVKVGNNSVIAAGSVVTEDVPENTVVAGSPAKIVKEKDKATEDKTQILDSLRK